MQLANVKVLVRVRKCTHAVNILSRIIIYMAAFVTM